MLDKLRSRHGIDLPVEHWGRSWGLTFFLGILALVLILGLLGAMVQGVLEAPTSPAMGVVAILIGLVGLAVGLFAVGVATTQAE